MKKLFRNALMVLASVAAVGCANDIDENLAPEQGEMVTVLLEVGGDTRTSLGSDLSVNWSMSDQLRVEYEIEGANNGIAEPATVVSCEGNKATFEIKLPADKADKALYAIYPYSSSQYGGWGTSLYNVTLPTEQAFVNGGFAEGVNVSAAVMNWTGKGYAAKFVNMGGLIRVPVSGDVKLKGVKITALNGEKMSGVGTLYNVDEEGCAWDGIGADKSNPNYIKIVSNELIDIATEKTFVFVAPAQTYSGGFALEFTAEDDAVYVLNLTDSKELARAGVVDLAAVTLSKSNFTGALEVNLRGTYKTDKQTSQWNRADAKKAMGKTIMTAEDAGFAPEEVMPKDGQKYGVIYEDNGYNNMVLYFDVATAPNANGMYDLINLQDRASAATGGAGYDTITHNASYYDPATGNIFFDFIIGGWWAPGGGGGEPLQNEGDVAGWGYTWLFYTGEFAKHPIVGEYTVEAGESAVACARPSHSMNTTIYDASYELFGSPAGGQKFCVNYNSSWSEGLLYFDIAGKANANGTYNLINLIDRAGGFDQVTDKGSWYNPTTGAVHFEFIILGWSTPGGGGGGEVAEGDEAGYLYCFDYTPAN